MNLMQQLLSNINKDSFQSFYKDKIEYKNNLNANPMGKIVQSGDDVEQDEDLEENEEQNEEEDIKDDDDPIEEEEVS